MSEETKQIIEEIKTNCEVTEIRVANYADKASKLGDKSLSEKLKKVKEASKEVVKHIVERQDKKS